MGSENKWRAECLKRLTRDGKRPGCGGVGGDYRG